MQFRQGTSLALLVLGASVFAGGCRGNPSETEVVIPTLPAAPANTILLFDSIDNENGGVGRNNWTSFQNWDVVDGCVDLHGNGFFDVQAGNGLYIDLDGSCRKGGTIQSKTAFALQQGTYTLEFWLAGNQRINTPDTVNVSLGTLYAEQFVIPRTQPFRSYTRNVVVPAPVQARLRFQNLGGDDQGALLDMVRLRRVQ
jgi:hypothetical protein